MGKWTKRKSSWLRSREMSLAKKQWGEHTLPKKVVFQNPKVNSSYSLLGFVLSQVKNSVSLKQMKTKTLSLPGISKGSGPCKKTRDEQRVSVWWHTLPSLPARAPRAEQQLMVARASWEPWSPGKSAMTRKVWAQAGKSGPQVGGYRPSKGLDVQRPRQEPRLKQLPGEWGVSLGWGIF